jgi:uncharacterized protein
MGAFRIRVADLEPGPNQVRLEASAAAAGLEPEVWNSPLALDLQVHRQGDQFTLRGTASTRVEEECARCLRHFDSPMVFEFTVFADRAAAKRAEAEAGLDDFVVRHDGRSLDLDEEVREQAILARPMLSLCRPDCAGLCPRCGADLNQGPCGCAAGGKTGPAAGPASD